MEHATINTLGIIVACIGYFYCIWRIVRLQRDVDLLLRWRDDAITTGRANPYAPAPPSAGADYLHKYNTEGR